MKSSEYAHNVWFKSKISIFNHIAVFRDVVSKLWATEDLKLSDVTEVGHL